MVLNISGISEGELKHRIAQRCSEFGSVNFVEITRFDPAAMYQFAMVQMSSPAEAMKLFAEWGTSCEGDSVTIRVEQSIS